MRSRRVSIFALLLAALTLGTGVVSASATTTSSYPAALGAFNPNGVVPGHWYLFRKTGVLYLNSGLLAGCHSAGARWQRTDGTQIRLIWAACDQPEIKLLSSTYAVTRTRIPAAMRDLSTLGANVDLVQTAPGGQVWRDWLQGDLTLTLVSVCPHQAAGPCAGLTAPAARYLAARLPGRPLVTEATSVVPPVSGLLGALVLLALMVVGADRMSRRAKLGKFHMVPGSQKLHSVDRAADDLRKISRRRWWAKLFIGIGAVLLVASVGNLVAQAQAQASAAGALVVGLVAGTAGVIMLRRYRHPLLSRERYQKRLPVRDALHIRRLLSAGHIRRVVSAGHIRRVLSAGLTLFLGLLSLLLPLVVLAGWVLAGLSGAEQDLSEILAAVVIVAIMACYFIDRGAQRLRARNLHEAMRRAPLRSMLYLRNFGDDTQKILTSRFNRRGVWQRSTGWLNPIGSARFEEVLARALAHSGPVLAVGQPGKKLRGLYSAIAPTLGAARTTLADDWLDHVTHWAINAHAVVVSATPLEMKEGFAEEMKTLAEKVEHGRIILVFGTGEKAALHQRFGAFMNAVRNYPLFHDLASGWLSDGALVLVHVPADGWGTWYGWGAERRTAWTYTAAIGVAMAFAEEAWARQAAKLIPPSEPAVQQEADEGATSQQLTGPPPLAGSSWAGMPLTETVDYALLTATAEAGRRRMPLDTKSLLIALIDADPAGRWDRICLNSRSREAIQQAGYEDPPLLGGHWNHAPMTRACAKALETAGQLSRQYRQNSLQAGFLVLGLISEESNAAARALNIDTQEQQTLLARLVQEDLIGTSLTDLRLGLLPSIGAPAGRSNGRKPRGHNA